MRNRFANDSDTLAGANVVGVVVGIAGRVDYGAGYGKESKDVNLARINMFVHNSLH